MIPLVNISLHLNSTMGPRELDMDDLLLSDIIINLAKSILIPFSCEWATCPRVLNSWFAYEKVCGAP